MCALPRARCTGRTPIQSCELGCGIATEHLDRIWEPFWQANQSLTRRQEGTGLGLSVTRRLVTTLRGTIDVQSEAGRGSVFVVTLPAFERVSP